MLAFDYPLWDGGATNAHISGWAGLLDSIKTGANAFSTEHGMSVWEYRAKRPEENTAFDAAMTSISQRAAATLARACR